MAIEGSVAPPTRRRFTRRSALLALKLSASAMVLYLLLRNVDVSAARDHVLAVDPRMVAAAVGCVALTVIFSGLRWHMLLASQDAGLPRRSAVALTFASQCFNNVLPSTVGGDAVRIGIAVGEGATLRSVFVATFLDRLAGLVGCVAATFAIFLVEPFGLSAPPALRLVVYVLLAAAVAGLLVLAMVRTQAMALLWRLSPGWAGHFARARLDAATILRALLWTAAMLGGIGSTLALLSAAGPEEGLGILRALAMTGPLVLAVALPLSIAGWGVREAVVVTLFQAMGMSPEHGLATSLLFGLVTLIGGLPGLVALMLPRYRRAKSPTT